MGPHPAGGFSAAPAAPAAPRGPSQPASPMEQLIEMGFADRSLNQRLLTENNNDLQATVTRLLRENNNNWWTSR